MYCHYESGWREFKGSNKHNNKISFCFTFREGTSKASRVFFVVSVELGSMYLTNSYMIDFINLAGRVRTEEEESGQRRKSQDRGGRVRTEEEETGQMRKSQDRGGRVRTEEEESRQRRNIWLLRRQYMITCKIS